MIKRSYFASGTVNNKAGAELARFSLVATAKGWTSNPKAVHEAFKQHVLDAEEIPEDAIVNITTFNRV